MFFYILGIILIIIDQVTKLLITDKLDLGQSIPVIDGILHFTYVRNPGIAFGLFPKMNIIIIILSIVTIFLLFSIYRKTNSGNLWIRTALIFIVSGAAGNLLDRIQYNVVIDFIDFRVWPVFNLADAFIVIGVVILFIIIFFTKEREKDAPDPFSIRAD
ncbi:MAG: signal peptidase II [bacterium]|nr:signal peptidase II [bacterium]